MHPHTPKLLGELVAAADRLVRDERPRGGEHDTRLAERLYAEAIALRAAPVDDAERLVDDATVWLAQALRNAEREGPLGHTRKWVELARSFLPWVRADFAVALDAARPATTEQGR